MELTIRLAEPEDSAQLLALLKKLEAESDTFCVLQNIETIDILTEAQNINMIQNTSNNVLLVVADADNNLYGLATATALVKQPTLAEIGLAVLKTYQGNGLAQALLAELIDWGNEFSTVETLFLTVQQRNESAYHIYQKFGFQEIPNSKRMLDAPQGKTYPTVDMLLDVTEVTES